ncbi:MAG: beta-ketoacyl-ACP synthase II [Thermoanaerobaculales bacterium]
MPRRVVVTGMGAITPVGVEVATVWSNLVAGRSGIGPITLFDTTGFDVRIAGEVKGFDPTNFMDEKDARRTDRFTQFAVAALAEALVTSSFRVTETNAAEVAVMVGSAIGGIRSYTRENEVLIERGPKWVSPFLIPAITVDAPSVQIALRTGARGPTLGVATTCASGADAIGLAFEAIRRGDANAALAGGCEAAVTPIAIAAFTRMRALSRRNDDPTAASRPFDAGRDGFVLAEGGAMLVLEELDAAVGRGAQPLAELIGYAATSDAMHVAAPDASGAGARRCLELALAHAGVEPSGLSYINAHGTGTLAGDPAEVRAIKTALGESAFRIPVSSTKSMTGHLIGGAGALEAIVCIEAIRSGKIPPTINLTTPDPECDLDFVPNLARDVPVETALSVSFGFGGHNAALVFRAWR